MRIFVSISLLLAAAAAGAQEYGLPVGGFPNWQERTLHQLTNRARMEPAAELARCTVCGPAELSNCYEPLPAMTLSAALNKAARFHSQSMSRINFIGSETPCALRADLANVYPAGCDGSFACACIGAGLTTFVDRVSLFGATGSTENIAYGTAKTPLEIFDSWLLEPAPDAPCASTDANRHRWSILKESVPSVGPGVHHGALAGCVEPCTIATQDFGTGGVAPAPALTTIISASHWTADGQKQGPVIEFSLTWYDVWEPLMKTVSLSVDGAMRANLDLDRGTWAKGAYSLTVTDPALASGCHYYYFVAARGLPPGNPPSVPRYPPRGSFAIGPESTCPDWIPTNKDRPVKGDLNGDRKADLIWRNASTGDNAYWFLDGAAVVGGGYLDPVRSQEWRLSGVGDFNRDMKNELYWVRHVAGAHSNEVHLWTMNGVEFVERQILFVFSGGLEVRGTGDFFNADAVDNEFIARDPATGANAWRRHATNNTLSVQAVPVLDWDMVGGADIDYDGSTEIIWWNRATGDVSAWHFPSDAYEPLTPTQIDYIGRVADTNWKLSAAGDFNGDGRADLAWHNTSTGDAAIWFLDGASVIDGAYVGRVADTNWYIAGPK